MDTPVTLDDATALLRHRRSLKPALMDPARPVPRDVLEVLLENATWAPTHGMTEPWRFVVFEGGARAALASALQSAYREATPPEAFRDDKFAKLGKNPTLAPAVVAIACHPGSNPKIPEIEEVEAVACAVQNLHLSAAAAGLGGFWSSPPVADDPGVRRFMGLPDGARCLGLFYLGYPAPGTPWPASKRKPWGEKVSWWSA